ncbi:long-chain fatty acid--CoA ligase [Mycolicibacterium flavescens]|uniref:AMP-dependent synthetase n=1 Tax=Mycolicibacterium flavescens TaxID=1776 RepID=A0A1E3RIY6_MYCFV|nr:fatty acid--CoA ligase family protein [Mycolicibacterium flavescens]MCV7280273.1 long-chain fatty acid--CoA ligase [Mycolicibacterium flavescens]ODQ89357.1 AMP-dependent synthetase [Mycolicibacterium flavescens]
MTSIREALGRLWDAPDEAPMLQQDGQWFSWGDIRVLSETLDRELGAVGAGPGARVAVVLENRMESVAALITLLRTERTMVTLSPLQPADRLGDDLTASAADYVLAPRELLENTVFGAVAADSGATVFAVDGGDVTVYAKASREPRAGDPGVLIEMLTSGTTGPAKRIPLRRKQMEASLSAALEHNNRPEVRDKPPLTGAVGMVILPIVHIGGLWSLLTALLAARPIVMLKRFSIEGWHAAIVEHRPILGGLPPPAIRAVLDSDIPREDLSSLRAMIAGTAPVDPDLVDAFLERFGIPILVTYGATEFAGAVAGWTAKDFRASWADKKGSVGRAFPGVRLQVVDDDGRVLGAGQTGRLQVASAQVGDSAENWVTTSDLAHIDADGYLYIDGRADDVIVRGGFKIAPETVVRALRSHEAVADAAVAGLPDQRLGQVPVAAVQVKDGATVTGEALREHCRSTLTPYEVPVSVFVVDELPRSAALKVDRRRLIALIEELQQQN